MPVKDLINNADNKTIKMRKKIFSMGLIFIAAFGLKINNIKAFNAETVAQKIVKNFDLIQVFENQLDASDLKDIISGNKAFTINEKMLNIQDAENVLEVLKNIVIENIEKTLKLPGLQLEEQLTEMIRHLKLINAPKKTTVLIKKINKIMEENRKKSEETRNLLNLAKKIKLDPKRYEETKKEMDAKKAKDPKSGGFTATDEERRLIVRKIKA